MTVVLDSSQKTAKYSSATFFHNQGILVHIDANHAIAHNKVILIDGETIITGSFNFSRAGTAADYLPRNVTPRTCSSSTASRGWPRRTSTTSASTSTTRSPTAVSARPRTRSLIPQL